MLRNLVPFSLLLTPTLLAQQFQVIPAAYTSQDAVSMLWIPGASRDVRHQTLIGQSHLQNLQGRTITALQLRRSVADEVFTGGAAGLAVTLATTTRTPLTASRTFADNLGSNAIQAFTGTITIPTSPATTTTPAWTANDTVRVQLQQPFVYSGGTLVIDLHGTAIAGQTADWWPADAVFEDLSGTASELADGCGGYGGATGRWSFVDTRTLLVGAAAHFWAQGPVNSFGIAVFGQGLTPGLPLATFGLNAPGCNLNLLPPSVVATVIAPFVPAGDPRLASRDGIADLFFPIPNTPTSLNLTLTTQWFEFSGPATSNAIEWSICGVAPTLDMALVEGHPSQPTGNVRVHMAHVFRLEHQ
ncbi:MAG: hypothetical protein IPK26_26640 [Planctomycetes bacterium]|nr:hypothetical protein [Planctomycetota bacterium]